MTTTPVANPATPPSTTAPAQTPDAVAQLSTNFSTFLTLLTTQLKNQDPTSPMDSNQFTQQLVQFSQVEQQIDTNSHLKTLISQGTSNASTMAATYLGKKVSMTNGNASLSNGAANWTYNLGTEAGSTALTISDAHGKVVYTGAGEITAGNHSFAWNGRDNNGNQLNDGTYTLAVNATTASGGAVTSSVASAGAVTQIDMTGGSPKLVIGTMEIDLADVAAIAN